MIKMIMMMTGTKSQNCCAFKLGHEAYEAFLDNVKQEFIQMLNLPTKLA